MQRSLPTHYAEVKYSATLVRTGRSEDAGGARRMLRYRHAHVKRLCIPAVGVTKEPDKCYRVCLLIKTISITSKLRRQA